MFASWSAMDTKRASSFRPKSPKRSAMPAYLPLGSSPSTHSGNLHHPQAGLERHPAGQPCQFVTLASVCPLQLLFRGHKVVITFKRRRFQAAICPGGRCCFKTSLCCNCDGESVTSHTDISPNFIAEKRAEKIKHYCKSLSCLD